MSFITSSWLALLLSLFILSVTAQEYAITGYTATGTGCPPSTVSSSTTSDSDNISLKYSDFTAYTGSSYSYSDSRKNCQLTLSVKVPTGYQFALDRFSHNASYSLGSGVTGSFYTKYYFQASLDEATGSGSISGPAKDDECSLANSFRPLVWSACGKDAVINVNTAIRVDNGNGTAYGSLTVRSTPAESFVWRKC